MMRSWNLGKNSLGLYWSSPEEGLFFGTTRLDSYSEIIATLRRESVSDGDAVWSWVVALFVWDEDLQSHRPHTLLGSGVEDATKVSHETLCGQIGWWVSKISASLLTQMESSAHEYDYARAFSMIPQSDRRDRLTAEWR
jgi:hypothetical protein